MTERQPRVLTGTPDYERWSINRVRQHAQARGITDYKIFRKHELAAKLRALDEHERRTKTDPEPPLPNGARD